MTISVGDFMKLDDALANPIESAIDLDTGGKHGGRLRLPHSTHRSAYGWILIPIASSRTATYPPIWSWRVAMATSMKGKALFRS